MFTTKELIHYYSDGVMSMQVVMVLSGISSRREFVEKVRHHHLPFATYLPDARAMMAEEKEEFLKRYRRVTHD